jgi:cbb3-type cytochrome oxidase subunit 3
MTAQAGERLFYKGEETWMAAEPLNQYLQKRNDIKFISPSTACWRGYFGQWEIKDNKLYLIGLEAYLEGYREVDLNYLFPRQKQVIADWFSGKIRVPQGEMLDYVHMGYASLFERDLILEIKNGELVNEYVVENEEEFQERLKDKERKEIERLEKQAKDKKKEKVLTVVAVILITLVLTGTIIGLNKLITVGTALAYLTSAIITIPILLMLVGVIYYISKKENNKEQDRAISFIGINFLVFVFIGICIGVFFLINWGTLLGYLTSSLIVCGLLFLVFLAIKNRTKK